MPIFSFRRPVKKVDGLEEKNDEAELDLYIVVLKNICVKKK